MSYTLERLHGCPIVHSKFVCWLPNLNFGIEDCDGERTRAPFWRNWVIASFEVTTGQKYFDNFVGKLNPSL